jgi:4-hydroxyphenylpyruvate dioxygenase
MVTKLSPNNTTQRVMDILTVEDFDSVEFWVGNAYQSAYYFYNALGFKPVAWSSLKTGNRDFASYVLKQRDATIILSTAYQSSSEMAAHHMIHGDGVKIIGLIVRDIEIAYSEATARGAMGIMAPTEFNDGYGTVKIAAIRTYGDVIHKFIERNDYKGPYLPGYEKFSPTIERPEMKIERIDHVVGNVNWFQMEPYVKFYHEVFGFEKFMEFSEKDIATQYSTLRSQVVRNYNHKVLMPINEPWHGIKTSQIEEYVTYYHGAGVQHIALHTSDILETVEAMIQRGVEFIDVPKTYYDNLGDRIGYIEEDIDQCAKLGILLDRDDYGYLLQIFTKPIQDRPTFFFEVIQRHGSQGFGKGNFQALFEAIEREQSERGNL